MAFGYSCLRHDYKQTKGRKRCLDAADQVCKDFIAGKGN